MKTLRHLSILILLLACISTTFSQPAKYETSQPYSRAQGYFITDSTAVRSVDSLIAFPVLPQEFSQTAKLVKKLEPYYPEEFLKDEAKGNVVAAGYIDSTGVVRKAVVLSSTEPRFNKHALFALIQWQFDPQKTTNVWIKVPFRFAVAVSN